MIRRAILGLKWPRNAWINTNTCLNKSTQNMHESTQRMHDLEMHEMTINILEQPSQKHAWITHTTRTNNHDNDIDNGTNQQSWTINTKTSIMTQINPNNVTFHTSLHTQGALQLHKSWLIQTLFDTTAASHQTLLQQMLTKEWNSQLPEHQPQFERDDNETIDGAWHWYLSKTPACLLETQSQAPWHHDKSMECWSHMQMKTTIKKRPQIRNKWVQSHYSIFSSCCE